jgi:hypothetical protein
MKDYRTIKFTYNLTTVEIDVRLENENVLNEELSSIRQTIDGSRWKQITGTSSVYTYAFGFCTDDVYDFFVNAYNNNSSFDVTFEREQDDGSFSSELVIIDLPQAQDDNIGVDDLKVYAGLQVRVLTA